MAIDGIFPLLVNVRETLATPENRSGAIYDTIREGYAFADGVGALQNDLVWSDRVTIAAGDTGLLDLAPLQLDLGGGGGLVAQTDAFGNAMTFVEVTAIAIFNRETVPNTRTIRFGPAAANPFLWLFVDATDLTSVVPLGGYMQWSDQAQVVTAGAADVLRFINTDGANGVTFDIIVVGRSA